MDRSQGGSKGEMKATTLEARELLFIFKAAAESGDEAFQLILVLPSSPTSCDKQHFMGKSADERTWGELAEEALMVSCLGSEQQF